MRRRTKLILKSFFFGVLTGFIFSCYNYYMLFKHMNVLKTNMETFRVAAKSEKTTRLYHQILLNEQQERELPRGKARHAIIREQNRLRWEIERTERE